ncbi:MAG: hypothetical protein LAP86_34845 [Acidobacteriia bacterium]|nr:hypothetical protein [Terriglobia bacterium]
MTEVITFLLNSMVQSVQIGAWGVASVNRAVASILRLWGEENGQDIADYALMLAIILAFVLGTIRLIGWSAR